MPVASKDSDHKKPPPFRDVSGVILVGGKSSRYGRNKALVELDGVPLIERVIRVMRPLFERLILITNTPHEYAHLKLPMYKDLIKGLGPIGGILTGLEAISNDAGFFVACDMPYLNKDLIHHIVASRDDFDVVAPRVGKHIEALHSLYSKRCLPAVRRKIGSWEYQVIRVFSEVSVRYVNEDEIRRFDPELKSFLNINRPQQLRKLSKQ